MKCCQIVTHMVMSVISAVASSVQLSLAVAAAAWDVYDLDYFGCYYFVGPYRPGSKVDVRHFRPILSALRSLLLSENKRARSN